ncbi:gamma-glutamylcyclotransferase [Stakelama sp. CBK3Z-3]|uniref:Gamma-glutamylcyclotransferase n=1 Tax=Stakelama flava TaxID=2860338 RepID=A0ABS6XKZ2_9SPHN|nr:gamma-glutamylcyclotransferase family protein [Stakelama flava]MBW4330867.1 gamma-glutamylcyclotransferase [Stakelama flava]
MERFFFYGTLRRGGRFHHQLRLANRARFIGEDRVAGRLYDCGPWPAALFGSGG